MVYENKTGSSAFMLVFYCSREHNLTSWLGSVHIMKECLSLAIRAKMKFDKNDFQRMVDECYADSWFRQNANGKGSGDEFYSIAREANNLSAMKSYEAFAGINSFIFENKRVMTRDYFKCAESKTYNVTGFDAEKGVIRMVVKQKGSDKKKLLALTNEEWLEFRKKNGLERHNPNTYTCTFY